MGQHAEICHVNGRPIWLALADGGQKKKHHTSDETCEDHGRGEVGVLLIHAKSKQVEYESTREKEAREKEAREMESKENRETFICACEADQKSALICSFDMDIIWNCCQTSELLMCIKLSAF
ncbi:hypothetical protein ACJX0J_040788 [Zea mays]